MLEEEEGARKVLDVDVSSGRGRAANSEEERGVIKGMGGRKLWWKSGRQMIVVGAEDREWCEGRYACAHSEQS